MMIVAVNRGENARRTKERRRKRRREEMAAENTVTQATVRA
jgi:hypothetical protein